MRNNQNSTLFVSPPDFVDYSKRSLSQRIGCFTPCWRVPGRISFPTQIFVVIFLQHFPSAKPFPLSIVDFSQILPYLRHKSPHFTDWLSGGPGAQERAAEERFKRERAVSFAKFPSHLRAIRRQIGIQTATA